MKNLIGIALIALTLSACGQTPQQASLSFEASVNQIEKDDSLASVIKRIGAPDRVENDPAFFVGSSGTHYRLPTYGLDTMTYVYLRGQVSYHVQFNADRETVNNVTKYNN